jgi:hypothetical protein
MRKPKDPTTEDRSCAVGIQTHTTVIDGLTYTSTTLPTRASLRLLPRLIQLFGAEELALMLAVGPDALFEHIDADPELSGNVLLRAAKAAADGDYSLDETAVMILQTTRCEQVRIGDNVVSARVDEHHFDAHFAARQKHLLKVCHWVCVHSFG